MLRLAMGQFDLEYWLGKYSVPIRRGPVPYPNGDRGARRWVLESCPWNNHADSSAFLIEFGSGAISAGCHHNSCQGFGWRDFRFSFEPGYDPSRTESGGSSEGTKPELSITNLADVVPKSVAWLWSGRIPLGKMTVVAEEPDLGKSFLTLDMATRVSDRGARWPDGAPVPHGNIVIVTAEDDLEDTIRPRLNALGAVAANVDSIGLLVRDGEKDVALSLPDHLPQIEEAIIKRNVILLIIDPLLAFTGGRRVDSYKQSEVRPLLTRLASLAQRTECAVVCVMHLNKNEKIQNPLNRISDSIAFAATARSVLGVAEHPDDPNLRVLVSIKHNLSARPLDLAYQISGNRSDEVGTFEWSSEPVAINWRNIFTKKENLTKVRVADHFLDQVLSQGSVESEILFEKAQHLEISISALNRAKKNRVGTPTEVQARRITTGNQGDGHWEWVLKSKADPDW